MSSLQLKVQVHKMCYISRFSVQVVGRKTWRLYPIANPQELKTRNLSNWTQVLYAVTFEIKHLAEEIAHLVAMNYM